MLNTLVVLLLVVAVVWVLWETWKNGWDVKKGIGGIVAALAAWWMWMHDSLSALLSGM